MASPRAPASALRAHRAVYRALGLRHRRHARGRGRGARALLTGVLGTPGIRLPPPLAAARRGAVGQPLRTALRHAVRRFDVPPPYAADDDRRRLAGNGRLVLL